MLHYFIYSSILTVVIIICYQLAVKIQNKTNSILLNPMLLTMAMVIPLLSLANVSIDQFHKHSAWLNALLEPAIVALGLPLYQQIQVIKKNIKAIMLILGSAITLLMIISYLLTTLLIDNSNIAIAISLKSITVPIGLALSEKLNSIGSLTAFMITIAGLTGGLIGHQWLNLLRIKSPQAQGLAIGCASHAIGTSSISRISHQHAAFGSLALVLSAIITAVIAPFLLPFLSQLA
ncbi:LrgB family protein [Thalassotalea agariperforans]